MRTDSTSRSASWSLPAILCSALFVVACSSGCFGSVSGSTKVLQIEPGVMVQLANDVVADVLIPTENGIEPARVRLKAGWYCGPLPELDDEEREAAPPPPAKKWYEFFAEAER